MMELTYSELQRMIEDAVERGLDQRNDQHHCPLGDVGITHDTHKAHHRQLDQVHKDFIKVRSAFIAGILVTITGGVLGLIWLGFKSKLFGGTP